MTVNEIVSFVKGLIKQTDQDKGPFPDKLIWEMFLVSRAEVLSNFRLRRFNYINPQNYTTICLELEPALSHQCGCITQGCDVLVTKNKVPKYFTGRNSGTLRVLTLDSRTIDIISEEEYFDVYLHNPIYDDIPTASIINEKIVVWNDLDLKGIQVKAFWEDVTKLEGIQWCDSSSNTPTCIDVYNKDIGIDKDLILECWRRMKLDLLSLPLQLREDTSNNTNAEE